MLDRARADMGICAIDCIDQASPNRIIHSQLTIQPH
jgi:hypothetical protein